MLFTAVQLFSVLTLTLAEPFCQTYPNYETRAYTYVACNGTYTNDLNSTRQFCQDNVEGGDVVTFPSYEEYKFMISAINDTFGKEFLYIPGFYQRADADAKYSPETGEYFWTDAPDTQITSESETYWHLFSLLIVNYTVIPLTYQQTGSFLLDLDGDWYIGVSLHGGKSAVEPHGDVICSKRGVPDLPEGIPTISTPAPVVGGFQYWIVITVAASVTVLGIIVGSIGFCVFRNTKHKTQNTQKYVDVPQSENGNHVPKQVTV